MNKTRNNHLASPSAPQSKSHKAARDDSAPFVTNPNTEPRVQTEPHPDAQTDPDAPPSLTDRQLACIEYLIVGNTKSAIAERLGVNPNTITRWCKDPAFVAALNARRAEIHEANIDRLRSLVTKALDGYESALRDIFDERARVTAAQHILRAAGLDILPPIPIPESEDD